MSTDKIEKRFCCVRRGNESGARCQIPQSSDIGSA